MNEIISKRWKYKKYILTWLTFSSSPTFITFTEVTSIYVHTPSIRSTHRVLSPDFAFIDIWTQIKQFSKLICRRLSLTSYTLSKIKNVPFSQLCFNWKILRGKWMPGKHIQWYIRYVSNEWFPQLHLKERNVFCAIQYWNQ